MTWPPALTLLHPSGWSLDAQSLDTQAAAFDALPWADAFAAMDALEQGALANPDEGRQVGHYWLRAPESAPTMGQAQAIGEAATQAQELARRVVTGDLCAEDGHPFTDALHIGIGGSSLGPRFAVEALNKGDGLRLHWLDNTDPDGIERTLAQLRDRLRHTLVVVVTKSGTSPETLNAYTLVRRALEAQGLDLPTHLAAITCPGSPLDARAKREGWLVRLPIWDWVGGRFSLTSAVGLFTLGLAGVDTVALLSGARAMDSWTRTPRWRDNPAALLAGAWHVCGHGQGARSLVVIPYCDRLHLFGRYMQQLIMESVGKRLDRQGRPVHQGLTVYGHKGSSDQHAYVQQLRDGRDDALVLFVQTLDDGVGDRSAVQGPHSAGDTLQGLLLGTRRALHATDRPSLVLTLPSLDPLQLGMVVALVERAVGLYGELLDINVYNQPGVEAGKTAATKVLALSERLRSALRSKPQGVAELAAALHADPLEVHYLLGHLTHTDRAQRHGDGWTATYSTP